MYRPTQLVRFATVAAVAASLLAGATPAYADTTAVARVRYDPAGANTTIANGTGSIDLGTTDLGVPVTSETIIFENVPDAPDPVEQMENVVASVTTGFIVSQVISPLFLPGGATRSFEVQCVAELEGLHTATVTVTYDISSESDPDTGPFEYTFTITCQVGETVETTAPPTTAPPTTAPPATTAPATTVSVGAIPATGSATNMLAVATLAIAVGSLALLATRRGVRKVGT